MLQPGAFKAGGLPVVAPTRSVELMYLPLKSLATTLGVLGIKLENHPQIISPQARRLLDAFATQIAMALERVQLSLQAEHAQVLQARENLERALLNSISHDLRTPLVTITGGLGNVLDQGDRLNAAARRDSSRRGKKRSDSIGLSATCWI